MQLNEQTTRAQQLEVNQVKLENQRQNDQSIIKQLEIQIESQKKQIADQNSRLTQSD